MEKDVIFYTQPQAGGLTLQIINENQTVLATIKYENPMGYKFNPSHLRAAFGSMMEAIVRIDGHE